MLYFIDTEFSERGPQFPIQLISIGIVAEDGREFYAVSSDFNPEDCNDWVKANVLPKLGTEGRCKVAHMKRLIEAFCDPESYGKPEFYGYFADYDWVVFCQIFGAMVNLPHGYPMYCLDIKQVAAFLGNPKLPEHGKGEAQRLSRCAMEQNRV